MAFATQSIPITIQPEPVSGKGRGSVRGRGGTRGKARGGSRGGGVIGSIGSTTNRANTATATAWKEVPFPDRMPIHYDIVNSHMGYAATRGKSRLIGTLHATPLP